MKKCFSIFLIVTIFGSLSAAQTSTTSGLTGFRRGLATVMFAGLGGAVLGLSTLSFYGEPQEHIGNIWTGLALGVIGGSTYVIVQSQKPQMALDPVPKAPRGALASASVFQYKWEF